MNFLRLLRKTWNDFFSDEVDSIDPSDPICRFIVDKRHFSSANNRVKPNAFLPEPTRQTSVFLIKSLSEDAIWTIGESALGQSERVPRGRAQLTASDVAEVHLQLLVDNPPPRHAIIAGWPSEKDGQKALAIELASRSQLILRSK